MFKKLFLPAVVLVIALISGFIFLSPEKVEESSKTGLEIPETLANKQRVQLVQGKEAIDQISKMHGTSIDIVEGYIAIYEDQAGQVILWLSTSPTVEEGQALFDIMDEKMPQSKVFTDREEHEVDGKKVIKVLGWGQEHYYWVEDEVNYWIAVQSNGIETVKEVMEKVN